MIGSDMGLLCLSFRVCREKDMADALVGGAFLSTSLQILFDRLASPEAVKVVRGEKLSDELLNKLKRKLLIVYAVLNDRC